MASVATFDWPFKLAVMVEVVEESPATVVIVKDAVVCSAGTITDWGRVARPLLLESVTEMPLGPDGPLSVTVPVEELPPITDVGFRLTEINVAGVMVSVADFAAPPLPNVIVAVVCALTGIVVIAKVTVVAPPATVTVVGTVASTLLDVTTTVTPPEGAGPDKVTVAVAELPPGTEVGFSDTLLTERLLMFSEADELIPSEVAVIVTVVLLDRVAVVIGKVA